MRLERTLAGVTLRQEGDAVATLLDATNRRVSGGRCGVLCVSCDGDLHAAVAEGLARAAVDAGGPGLWVERLTLAAGDADPLGAALSVLGLPPGGPLIKRLEALRDELSLRSPAVLLVDAAGPPAQADACVELLDRLDKLPPRRGEDRTLDGVSLLVVGSGAGWHLRGDARVTGLYPTPDPVLLDARAARPHRWRVYLHHRLAWEGGGGDPAAGGPGEEEILSLGVGDDAGLETLLNRAAADAPADTACCRATRAALRGGTLGTREADAAAAYLVCQPLHRLLLGEAMRLEVRALSRYGPLASGRFDDRSRADCTDFLAGRHRLCDSYPEGHPHPPASPAAFGSLGSLARRYGRSHQDAATARLEDLRDFRNALAHQHYVTWRDVEMGARLRAFFE